MGLSSVTSTVLTLFLASFVTSVASRDLFFFETIQLEETDLSSLAPDAAALFSFADPAAVHARKPQTGCKAFPGDADWPSERIWGLFNDTLDGALIKTVPIAAPCYPGPNYDAARCNYVVTNWANSSMHELDPSSMMSHVYQGETCPPAINPNGTCTLGGFPSYVVNATTIKQIQLAVNFARNAGIRLIVKNTGHDFAGKSGGAGSLSIWTHYLKSIKHIPRFDDAVMNYSGPAMKGGSGIIARDIYKAADEHGLIVVGGEGQDVGLFGGYVQGGGHSPMSSVYGMAADQVLAMEIVTANGSFVTASSTENTDLFWALRGGGGSTWGVVTSVTVRGHPSTPITAVQFSFSSASNEVFWLGVRAYWKHFITYADAGIYSYFFIYPGSPAPLFNMQGFWAPNKTKEETAAFLKPWLDDLAALNISVAPIYTTYPSAYPAILGTFPQEAVDTTGGAVGSRLFPRTTWEDPAAFNATFDVWSASGEDGILISFNIRAPNALGVDNAVLPAWRETVMHAIQGEGYPVGGDAASWKAVRKEMSEKQLKWKAVSPNAGAYLGECDIEEVDWQKNFYGVNYPRLLDIKRDVDPWNLFWARTAVGSEVLSVRSEDPIQDENGRLCWNHSLNQNML